jgi:hypothetical protein
MPETSTSFSVSIAETFTRIVSHTTTITSAITPSPPSHTSDISPKERIIIGILVEVPLTCESYLTNSRASLEGPSANPDIAGVGVCVLR